MQVLILWIPVLLWATLIFYLSSIPSLNSGLGIWDMILRKIAHMIEFGVFTGLFYRAARVTWAGVSRVGVIKLSMLVALSYAVTDEFHQSFVPGRGPSVVDVAIDGIGILIGGMYLLWALSREKKSI